MTITENKNPAKKFHVCAGCSSRNFCESRCAIYAAIDCIMRGYGYLDTMDFLIDRKIIAAEHASTVYHNASGMIGQGFYVIL